MRLKHRNPETEKPKPSRTEPMAEGIAKERKPHGFYTKMSDDDISAYARKFMKKEGINRRKELAAASSALYQDLHRRERKCPGILEKIGFEDKQRDWTSMSDDELVAHAKTFMEENRISGRKALGKKDPGMYTALLKRERDGAKILDRVGFEGNGCHWKWMKENEIVVYTKRFMKQKGMHGKEELKGAAPGLYKALCKREKNKPGIIKRIGFEETQRDWKSMDDDELAAYTRKFMKKKRISSKSELEKADKSLYFTLLERKKANPGIMAKIGFEEKLRYWNAMDDDELAAFTRKFMKEKGIREKNELEKADYGLYMQVLKRERENQGIMESIGFASERREMRRWKSDVVVLAFARWFIEEEKIQKRVELQKADPGLCNVLKDRKLMDEVGLPDSNEKHKDWAGMGRKELIAYAKAFIERNGIASRMELMEVDRPTYSVLLRRKLLDAAFSDAESAKHAEAVDGVLDALDSFGDDG